LNDAWHHIDAVHRASSGSLSLTPPVDRMAMMNIKPPVFLSLQQAKWALRLLLLVSALPMTLHASALLNQPTASDQFPDATSTGVPPGTTLIPLDGLVIDTPGEVIEGVNIQGPVVISASNVTLRNCKVTAKSDVVVFIKPGVTGAVVQNCEINNQGAGGQGIAGQGTFLSNNIHDCADGIDVRGNNTVIQGNFIHSMNGTSKSHYDGIQADGGFSNLKILRNTVINQRDQTSAIMLDNYWGPIKDVTIDGNLLIGGGYTVYINEVARGQAKGGRLINVRFTNNRLSPGTWGHLDLRTELGASPVIAGNTVVKRDDLQRYLDHKRANRPRQ